MDEIEIKGINSDDDRGVLDNNDHEVISDDYDKNVIGKPQEPAKMKVSEGMNLQQAFFQKISAKPVKGKLERSSLVEPIFVNKRSSGIRYQNFVPTFKFTNAHEGSITCLSAIKRGIFLTAGTDGFIKFWQPLENVPIATLDESEAGAAIDFVIPVVG